LVLRLVETQADSRARSVDVPGIARPRDLRDSATLGLTLAEAKRLLARVQQVVTVYTPQEPCSGRRAYAARAAGTALRTKPEWR